MTFEQIIEEMNSRYSDAVDDPEQLEQYCCMLNELNEKYEQQVKELIQAKATIKFLSSKMYAPRSEKTEYIDYENSLFSLLDEEIEVYEPEPEKETVEVKAYRRPKSKGYRAEILKVFPHEKEVSDLNEKDRICDVCGSSLEPVGEEFIRSEVIVEPPTIRVIDHYVKTYECRVCRKETGSAHMIKAPLTEPLIRHSFASASLAAQIIHNKFALGLPLYRQEKEWEALGLSIGRETMSNWMMILCRDWLYHITERFRRELLGQRYIHIDETVMQVMKEPGRKDTTKSYFWVYASIESSRHPVRMFVYEPGRSGNFPKEFLSEYVGTIITDAYNGYNNVVGVQRALCWAHARRAYTDALPSGKKEGKDTGLASKGIAYINKLFELEEDFRDLSPSEKAHKRIEFEKPVLEAYWSWVDESIKNVLPKSAVGKALNYSSSNRENLSRYIYDGNIPISNNLAENSIRPLVIGRKNFLFCGSPGGAAATACIYSIIETAKANGLDAHKYVEYLLKEMPRIGYDHCREQVDRLLPWNEEIQAKCK